jgi:endogenous inhibitor of DNA gyrase (YacG/DUF329 family)
MIVKALSVKQPWASLIAEGEKTIETRTWATDYRGPLLIVSSRKPADQGPAGVALAIGQLVGCRAMTASDEPEACCGVYPNAVAWLLDRIRPVDEPWPVTGQLGLFDVDVTGRDVWTDYAVPCPRCGAWFAWQGRYVDRPACPACGDRLSLVELADLASAVRAGSRMAAGVAR